MNTKVKNLIQRFEAAKTSQEEVTVFYEASRVLTEEEAIYFDAEVERIIDLSLETYTPNTIH